MFISYSLHTTQTLSELLCCYICADWVRDASLCPHCSQMGCYTCIKVCIIHKSETLTKKQGFREVGVEEGREREEGGREDTCGSNLMLCSVVMANFCGSLRLVIVSMSRARSNSERAGNQWCNLVTCNCSCMPVMRN